MAALLNTHKMYGILLMKHIEETGTSHRVHYVASTTARFKPAGLVLLRLLR